MIIRRCLTLFVVLLAAVTTATAQTTHSATLTWIASSDAAANPSLTYNVYKLLPSGACPAISPTGVAGALILGFQKINTTPITALTFIDSGTPPPLALGLQCYFATALLNGAESVPSNLIQTVILPAPPTGFTGAVK
jgi:hypothetical protein